MAKRGNTILRRASDQGMPLGADAAVALEWSRTLTQANCGADSRPERFAEPFMRLSQLVVWQFLMGTN